MPDGLIVWLTTTKRNRLETRCANMRFFPFRLTKSHMATKLSGIQEDIQRMLLASSEALAELAKPQPNSEVTRRRSQDFLVLLKKIHENLSYEIAHLNKVSSGIAHSGSLYGLEKDYELTVQELEVIQRKVNHLYSGKLH